MDKFLDTLKTGFEKVKDVIPGVNKEGHKEPAKDSTHPATSTQPAASTQPATTTRAGDAAG
jgi:hypothetical protein